MTQLVQKRLYQKYSSSFHFFEVRPINEIINGHYDSKTFIDLSDARIFIDDTEYLRRVYYYRTLTGRPEIDHRIKLCGQYYSKTLEFAHHYPMMIVTNTKSLFVKRNRRLKKIQAGEGSSDQTEQADENLVNFNENQSVDFLEDLDNSSIDGIGSAVSNSNSYDSEQYDVFDNERVEEEPHSRLDLKTIDESSLSHLITDLTPKPKKVEVQTQKSDAESTAPFISKPALLSIDNKLPFGDNSISITAITSDKLPLEKQRKKSHLSKYFDLLQDNRGYILSGLISNYENSGNSDNLTRKISTPTPNIDGQKEKVELENRRKKIREKAEQLLRRAKNESEEFKATPF